MTESAAQDHRPISSVREAAVLWTRISFKKINSGLRAAYYATGCAIGETTVGHRLLAVPYKLNQAVASAGAGP